MRIKIALCDDDKRALPVIAGATESAFASHGMQVEIENFSQGEKLLKAMETNRYQLVMLDIEMPSMDGIAVGKALRARGDDTRIVYVSEAESRVFESFYVQPLGFVRKSNFLNDIAAVVELYIKESSKDARNDILNLDTRSGMMAISSRQIRYIEGNRNYQILYVEGKDRPVEVKMTIGRLEELTKPYGFIRVHKGFLVNYQYIEQINTNELSLRDGTIIPIGRSKSAEVKMAYLQLIGK